MEILVTQTYFVVNFMLVYHDYLLLLLKKHVTTIICYFY